MNAPAALLDVAQVARWLNLGESTVRDLAARQRLPAYRISGQWRFEASEVRDWLAARHSIPRAEPSGTSRRARQRASARPSEPSPIFADAPWHPRAPVRQSGRRSASEGSR